MAKKVKPDTTPPTPPRVNERTSAPAEGAHSYKLPPHLHNNATGVLKRITTHLEQEILFAIISPHSPRRHIAKGAEAFDIAVSHVLVRKRYHESRREYAPEFKAEHVGMDSFMITQMKRALSESGCISHKEILKDLNTDMPPLPMELQIISKTIQGIYDGIVKTLNSATSDKDLKDLRYCLCWWKRGFFNIIRITAFNAPHWTQYPVLFRRACVSYFLRFLKFDDPREADYIFVDRPAARRALRCVLTYWFPILGINPSEFREVAERSSTWEIVTGFDHTFPPTQVPCVPLLEKDNELDKLIGYARKIDEFAATYTPPDRHYLLPWCQLIGCENLLEDQIIRLQKHPWFDQDTPMKPEELFTAVERLMSAIADGVMPPKPGPYILTTEEAVNRIIDMIQLWALYPIEQLNMFNEIPDSDQEMEDNVSEISGLEEEMRNHILGTNGRVSDMDWDAEQEMADQLGGNFGNSEIQEGA
ncbi:hypothetical protein EDC01DRAFT_634258 [Geopyxis carbonaria]|nr:hypothetical protein EDC01DRAFT_634258 [Geopyxis carbonaria]